MTNQVVQKERKPRRRNAQERGGATKSKLLEAAVQEFSERGYDGVTLKDIETIADVQRGLVKYHFGGKEEIFKAAADHIFEGLNIYRAIKADAERDLEPRDRLRFRIRSFVRYSAAHPELNRMMVQEGKQDSWRLRYILDNSLRQIILNLQEAATEHSTMTREDFYHWYYCYIGAGAFMFTMAPEARKLFGIDVTSEEVIDRHADMVAELLLSKVKFDPS